MVQRYAESSPFEEWRALLVACEDYANLTGWRFVLSDFMAFQERQGTEALNAAREAAMPTALDYADRVRSCATACSDGAAKPHLITEFEACQRIVATEAIYNSMLATVRAVGLGGVDVDAGGGGSGTEMVPQLGGPDDVPDDEADAFAYHDMSQPIEVIARRLVAHERRLRATPEVHAEKQRRALHASFIVEFGLEHGLTDRGGDATAEGSLTEFLERLGEWDGGKDNETVRALVLGAIPRGPAEKSLRSAAATWFDEHKGATLVGGALLGGLVGIVAASAVLASAARPAKR